MYQLHHIVQLALTKSVMFSKLYRYKENKNNGKKYPPQGGNSNFASRQTTFDHATIIYFPSTAPPHPPVFYPNIS